MLPWLKRIEAFGTLEGQNYKKRKATALGEKLSLILAKMEIFPVKKLCGGYDFHIGKWKYRRGSSIASSTPIFGRIPLLARSPT